MNTTATCKNCSEIKPLYEFYKSKNYKSGYNSSCKTCTNERCKRYYETLSTEENNIPEQKTCTRCEKTKQITEFNKNKRMKDGHSIYCKDCSRSYENAKNKIRKHITIDDMRFEKTCRKCKQTLPVNMFSINVASSDKRSYVCKECTPKPKWKTPETIQQYRKNYQLKNPDKIKAKHKKQGQQLHRKLRLSQNARIKHALQNFVNGKKTKNTVQYIGCDIQFLKQWLEFQFTDGMSFDNYGEWHIDHVKPCCAFDLSKQEDIEQCFNWKNLQPLWKKDNMHKSGKVCNEIITAHIIKVNKFLSLAQVKEGKLREPPKVSSTPVVV